MYFIPQTHLEDNTKLRRNLITKLESLWTRMELPLETQKKFLDEHFGYSDHVIVKIKEEVICGALVCDMNVLTLQI